MAKLMAQFGPAGHTSRQRPPGKRPAARDLYLATVMDPFSRRLLGYAMSETPQRCLRQGLADHGGGDSRRHRWGDLPQPPVRHSVCDGLSPIDCERLKAEAERPEAA